MLQGCRLQAHPPHRQRDKRHKRLRTAAVDLQPELQEQWPMRQRQHRE